MNFKSLNIDALKHSSLMTYLYAVVISMALALVAYVLMPAYYESNLLIADEGKEMDISIGLSSFEAWMKKDFMDEEPLKDPDIYSQVLSTKDYLSRLSKTFLKSRSKTYAQYLGKDSLKVIEEVTSNFRYRYFSRYNTIGIRFSDRDAKVAAEMAESSVTLLRVMLREQYLRKASIKLQNARNNRLQAGMEYKKAQREYSQFVDTHGDMLSAIDKQTAESLLKERNVAFDYYNEQAEQYVRALAQTERSIPVFSYVKRPVIATTPFSPSYIELFLAIAVIAIIINYWRRLYTIKNTSFFHLGGTQGALSVFSPWNLTVSIWLGWFTLFFFTGDIMDPLGDKFYTSLTLWLTIFLSSSILTYWLCCHRLSSFHAHSQHGSTLNMALFNSLLALTTIITPVFAYSILKTVLMFDTQDMLYNIRLLAVYGDTHLGILNYAQVINLSLFIVAIWHLPKVGKLKFTLIIALNLLSQLAVMEKSGILIMILAALFVLYEKRKIRLHNIAITLGAVIFLFFFFNMVKEDQSSDAESMPFFDFLGMYVLSPAVAYERLSQDISTQFGSHTFQTIYLFLARFGLDVEVNNRLLDFVFVPIPTNVYTIFQPFYEDFGHKGVAMFALIYGTLFGAIYAHHSRGNIFARCVYTYLCEVIIIQFYNENLLQNLVMFVQVTFFIYILVQDKITFSLFHEVAPSLRGRAAGEA